MTAQLNFETPVALLTVGQLLELVKNKENVNPIQVGNSNEKKLTYGLSGIKSLFNCSHATAQRYKDTFLKEAVSQQGRKIVVDVDFALELFKNHKTNGK